MTYRARVCEVVEQTTTDACHSPVPARASIVFQPTSNSRPAVARLPWPRRAAWSLEFRLVHPVHRDLYDGREAVGRRVPSVHLSDSVAPNIDSP
eukprot:284155-Pyramimonas_sp.AAC.1